jgi:hypothetical protein
MGENGADAVTRVEGPLDASMSAIEEDGDRLVSQLLSKERDGSILANDLLREVHRGFPVERLRVLLESDDPEIVRLGAWLQSELGSRAQSLAPLLPRLLRHELKYVRFFAIDSVASCATPDDGPLLAETVRLIDDAERSVRWKAMDFLRALPEASIRSTINSLPGGDSSDQLRVGLQAMLATNAGSEVPALLASGEPVQRRFGLAVALRSGDEDALALAANSSDEEIRDIASEALARRRKATI